MKHGKGTNQYMLTKTYEDRRRKLLLNRYRYSGQTNFDEDEHNIVFGDGGGATDEELRYIEKSICFPIDNPKKKFDKRDVPWAF